MKFKRLGSVFLAGREFVLSEVYSSRDQLDELWAIHLCAAENTRMWYLMEDDGREQHSPHGDKLIPLTFKSALKMWWATDGYGGTSLIDFLTNLGVLS